jgi:hypothetical protein
VEEDALRHTRRHVHTLGADLFSPAACLLALAAATPGTALDHEEAGRAVPSADPRDALPSTHRATWLPEKHRQGAR